jgi:hypothetical protein
MNYISFITVQLLDFNRMIFVQEKTATWKVLFHLVPIKNRAECKTEGIEFQTLLF